MSRCGFRPFRWPLRWGDWFYDDQKKVWTVEATGKRGFCQYIMRPIIQLVRAIMEDEKDKYEGMMERLGIEARLQRGFSVKS